MKDISTLSILELLHMDLVRLVEIESFRGKEYVFVCVHDFSIYKGLNFLRENFDTFNAFTNLVIRF